MAKKKSAKKSVKKKGAKRRGRPSGGGENKAAAIREYSSKNPDAGPSEIAKALNSEKGWDITAQYVSTIKSNDKRRGGVRGKRGRPPGTTKDLTVDKLLKAKELAEQLGGVKQAKAALDTLDKLSN